jgi:hypothetical protein
MTRSWASPPSTGKHLNSRAVRVWAAIIIGLLAGVAGDYGTELLAGYGWLRDVNPDVDQQGILPGLAVTAILALGLFAYVAASRICPNDPLLRKLDDSRARALDAIAAFAVSWITIVAIEGYETHFGGTAPFDATSTVLAHAPVLVVAFLTIAVAVRTILGAAIRFAARSAVATVALLASFLRFFRGRAVVSKHAMRLHLDTSNGRLAAGVAGACGLRAPPRMFPNSIFLA